MTTTTPHPPELDSIEERLEFAEATLRDLAYCAFKFDDKPHHLFSALNRVVADYGDESMKAEAFRLMNAAYARDREAK